MKRSILWSLAIVTVLGSAQVNAMTVSFGFEVTLDRFACSGFDICYQSQGPDTGTVFVTLDIADPFADQVWNLSTTTAVAIVFPALAHDQTYALSDDLVWSMFGTYDYDADTGFATATLGDYSGEGFGTASVIADERLWRVDDWPATYNADAVGATNAYAVIGPPAVPIPAAAYLFMSALAGIVGIKRFARKS
jgi:hypothetical protein